MCQAKTAGPAFRAGSTAQGTDIMLRSNIRLVFGGLGAVAIGLAGGWAVLALTFQETSALTRQAAIARPAVPDARERTAPVATPAPDSEPAEIAIKPEPAGGAPKRSAERTPPVPAAPSPNADAAPSPARSPMPSSSTDKPTKVAAPADVKRRVPLRHRDDDDDD